jgi:hypothetical protein
MNKEIIKVYCMSRGVFWVVDGELLAYPFMDDEVEGIAKSGETYNHKKLWTHIKPKGAGNITYNHYPRGRVELSNKGKPIIYLNPNIDKSLIPEIRAAFGLTTEPEIREDHSQHYKSYLDDGWVPEP